MRNVYKRLMVFSMVLIVGILMAACGGKQDASTSGASTKEFVYIPEYQEINESSNISNIAISNNTIFYTGWNYDETTQAYSSFIRTMEIGDTQGTDLPIELSENDSVSSFLTDSDGNLILMINSYVQGETEDDFTQTYVFKKYDKEGKELSTMDLTSLLSGEDNPYIQYTALDNEGNVYLSNGQDKIWVLDTQGNQLFTIDIDTYMQAMGTSKEGKVVIATYATDKFVFQDIDFANKKIGTTYENVPSSNGSYTLMKGADKGCLVNTGNSLYEYDFETQTSEEILNWIDSDINSDSISAIALLEDGRILAVTSEYAEETSKTELVYLTKKASSEVTEKTILTLGTMYLSSDIRNSIIDFNKTNETYRIRVKEYGTDDYETGTTQLNSDIVSGNAPDIIDLSNGNTEQYIEKGILEDLYPYIDKDADIKKEDFQENVLKAYEKDGKLYAILPSFTVVTVVGKSADVGDKMGWKLDDLMTLVKSKPEGTEIFDYATKDSILSSLCMYGLDQFVDWETGKCTFDSDSFIQMLEFANTFNSDYVYDESAPSMPNKIQSGQLLLSEENIYDVQTYQVYEAMYGEPITFIGYPSETGNGSAISSGNIIFGMSSKSKNKDGAWEFIRKFMMNDYQTSSNLWGFPILKSALEAKLNAAMTPEYYEDETGKQAEQSKTSWGYDDFNVDIYAATQEEVDAVKNLIDNANGTYQYNSNMYSIISEEAAAYFSGQKTSKDVADVIQSRLQIYVNENR
ncbi:MAG: ABC transporter substrate-binding protein [Lachnotalea sp.]